MRDAEWLHLTGGNLVITEASYEACLRAMNLLSPSATVSFDPNIRAEWLNVDGHSTAMAARAGAGELHSAQCGRGDAVDRRERMTRTGCRQLAAAGKVVVLKRGAAGCTVFSQEVSMRFAGFDVDEVDPTGAGDTFCAGFTVAILDGLNLYDAAVFANAVGALAVTKKGPMEGAPTRNEVSALINRQRRIGRMDS